jgi:hypothetical protein
MFIEAKDRRAIIASGCADFSGWRSRLVSDFPLQDKLREFFRNVTFAGLIFATLSALNEVVLYNFCQTETH